MVAGRDTVGSARSENRPQGWHDGMQSCRLEVKIAHKTGGWLRKEKQKGKKLPIWGSFNSYDVEVLVIGNS